LHELLRDGRIAEQATSEAVDRAPVPAIRLGQRLLLVPTDGDDEDGVAGGGQVDGGHEGSSVFGATHHHG